MTVDKATLDELRINRPRGAARNRAPIFLIAAVVLAAAAAVVFFAARPRARQPGHAGASAPDLLVFADWFP